MLLACLFAGVWAVATDLVKFFSCCLQLCLDIVCHDVVVCVGESLLQTECPRRECATAMRSAAFETAGVRCPLEGREKPVRLPCSTKISGARLARHQKAGGSRHTRIMGGAGITGRTRPTKVKKQASAAKRKRDDVDVEKLEAAVAALVRSLPPFDDMPQKNADRKRNPSPARTKTSPTSLSPSRPKQA